MKLLLDENLPRRLKRDFQEQEVHTVRDRGWNGLKNGQLLQKMLEEDFDALLTFDKNIQHQQNFTTYPITVLLLTAESNQYKYLQPLTERINVELRSLSAGVRVIS